MNCLKLMFAAVLSLAGVLCAKTVDLFYADQGNRSCLSKNSFFSNDCFDKIGSSVSAKMPQVRLRFIDPPELASAQFGFYLERPFFIIDGIHLSTDEKRTLSQLHRETEEFGIPEMLKSLGYTPVLVQFSETVIRSLQQNSGSLASLLNYLSENRTIPFPNGKQDGFVILGISQGGIIGRYGSYLYDTKRNKAETAPVRFFASLPRLEQHM